MRLRNCLGMIWSVSTFARSSGATTPVTLVYACISVRSVLRRPGAHVHEVAGDGRRCRHLRAHQVGAPALALPSLEVPVRCGGAALARLEDVRIHAQAHRAACLTPVEAGRTEDLVEPFILGLE